MMPIENFRKSIPIALAFFVPLASAAPLFAQEMAKPTMEMQAAKTLPKLEMHKMHVMKLVAAH